MTTKLCPMITTDLHFGHNRDFIFGVRGFKDVDEMNKTIVKNWNEIVTDDTDVYILGDLMLNDNEAGIELIKQLKGKLHIVYGNHDTDTRKELYNTLPNVVEARDTIMLDYGGYHFYLTHYPTIITRPDTNKPLKKIWINLCGHTHTKDKFADMNIGVIYHCELEAHNNKPISLDYIIDDLINYTENN